MASDTAAPDYVLTLDEALALARAQAPSVRLAQTRVAEAEAGLLGASPALRENPTVALGAGPRFGAAGAGVDLQLGVEQVFELGGGREARIAASTASVERAAREVDDAARNVLAQVARAFLQGRYAEERLLVVVAAEQLASDLQEVAQGRHDAGDIGVMDVHLTALTWSRVQAERQLLEVAREQALGRLRALLGLEPNATIALRGELLDRHRYELVALLERAHGRSDLRLLEARAVEAEAEAQAARSQRWPELGAGLEYAHEEGDDIVLGTVSLTLPFFEQGQGQEAVASARSASARSTRAVAEATIQGDVQAAFEAYRRLVQAVETYEQTALPRVAQSEALVRRSYEAGAMKLVELLAVYRELAEARVAYTELLLSAAQAGLELEIAAGVL